MVISVKKSQNFLHTHVLCAPADGVTLADQHGSDRFPIGIHSYTAAPSVTNGTWKPPKADWATFSSKSSSELGQIHPDDLEDPVGHFTDTRQHSK